MLVATAGTLVGWRFLFPGRRGRLRAFVDMGLLALPILLGLVLSLADNIYYYATGVIQSWLISNSDGLNSALRVPVEIKNFIPLDLPTYLTQPWMNAWDDASGRANFWNYLFRSSLSGEFSFRGPVHEGIAYIWGGVLLLLAGLSLFSFGGRFGKRGFGSFWKDAPWWIMSFFWLASIVTLRIQTPFSCSNDFRYIFPIIVPFALIAANSGRLARICMLLLPLLSTVFYFGL